MAPPAGTAMVHVDRGATVTRLALDATSWVDVTRGLVVDPDAVHADVLASTPWQQGRVWRYERWIDDPRLSAFVRGPDRHPALVEVEAWLQARYRVGFDGLALSHYRDGRDGVGWHRDREMRWLDDTVIGVLTLGATRPWRLRPASGRRRPQADDDLTDAVELHPAAGDVLVMGGRCQADWLHAVPQVRTAVGGRVSAQWRWTSGRGRRDTEQSFFAPRNFSR